MALAARATVPERLYEALRVEGGSAWFATRRLTLPLMMGGVIGGMVLTWVTVASELSSTVVLYSGPWATMTVVMFQALESTGAGIASAAASVLIVVTLVPVALVYRLLRRYELERQGDQAFERLSGGQQARFQILLLELAGTTALLLDEPTDNLDLESAEALQDGLEVYDGTVMAVTHDRWFAKSFDRYLVFGSDGVVRETAEPVWDERRVERKR